MPAPRFVLPMGLDFPERIRLLIGRGYQPEYMTPGLDGECHMVSRECDATHLGMRLRAMDKIIAIEGPSDAFAELPPTYSETVGNTERRFYEAPIPVVSGFWRGLRVHGANDVIVLYGDAGGSGDLAPISDELCRALNAEAKFSVPARTPYSGFRPSDSDDIWTLASRITQNGYPIYPLSWSASQIDGFGSGKTFFDGSLLSWHNHPTVSIDLFRQVRYFAMLGIATGAISGIISIEVKKGCERVMNALLKVTETDPETALIERIPRQGGGYINSYDPDGEDTRYTWLLPEGAPSIGTFTFKDNAGISIRCNGGYVTAGNIGWFLLSGTEGHDLAIGAPSPKTPEYMPQALLDKVFAEGQMAVGMDEPVKLAWPGMNAEEVASLSAQDTETNAAGEAESANYADEPMSEAEAKALDEKEALSDTTIVDVDPDTIFPPIAAKAARGIAAHFGRSNWLGVYAILYGIIQILGANVRAYFAPLNIWAAPIAWLVSVGPTGTTKSSALARIKRIITDVEEIWHKAYKKALREWQWVHEEWEHKKRAAIRNNEDFDEPEPERPVEMRMTVGDATIEALIEKWKANPGGVANVVDEIREFFSSFGRYKKGSNAEAGDKAKFLSAYSGVKTNIARKGDPDGGYYVIPWCSILGTTQGAVLREMFTKEDAACGFLQRFQFMWVTDEDDPPLKSCLDIPPYPESDVDWLFNTLIEYAPHMMPDEGDVSYMDRLRGANLRENGDFVPLYFSQTAKLKAARFVDLMKKRQAMLPKEDPEYEAKNGIITRTIDFFFTLCIVEHTLAYPTAIGTTGTIDDDDVRRAIAFIIAHEPHNARAWGLIMDKKVAPKQDSGTVMKYTSIQEFVKSDGKNVRLLHYEDYPTDAMLEAARKDVMDRLGCVEERWLGRILNSMGFKRDRRKFTVNGKKIWKPWYIMEQDKYDKHINEEKATIEKRANNAK